MFNNSKWIWGRDVTGSDTYCDFISSCICDSKKQTLIRIASDSNYALYINGQYVESGQYSDYPNHRVYDEIDISKYIVDGINYFAFTVWYMGDGSFIYSHGEAGLIYEIESDGELLLCSDEHTRSSKSERYIPGNKQMITLQLGYSFELNMERDNDWMLQTEPDGFSESFVVTDASRNFRKRENKKLVLKDRMDMEIVQQGTFTYPADAKNLGSSMQRSALSFIPFDDIAVKKDTSFVFEKSNKDIYIVLDMKEETTGFFDFDIETDEACKMVLGWGEHLEDGRCRTEIDARDFSATIHLRKGRNAFMNPLRRFGCRYLQLFFDTSKITIHYAGIRPTIYPLHHVPYHSGNLLQDTIYQTCVHTLAMCMHEHYEDCPWREQALYTLDSRNQMLCGYYAFEEFEFPKSALKLISHGLRADGLLPITAPTDCELTIPFFSLMYIVQVWEYYLHSKDMETLQYCFPVMKQIIDTFISLITENGLIHNLVKENCYWNFYEWQPFMDGHTYEEDSYDVCANAAFSIALNTFVQICDALEKDSKKYQQMSGVLNRAIRTHFYDEEKGLFRICLEHDTDKYSVLGNALCVLCGAADDVCTETIEELLTNNELKEDGITYISSTLSMFCFRYDALLAIDAEKYKAVILNDIETTYLYMLRQGATTFWETIKGHADFDNAGSLCHGWSALPVYYYWKLL